jgi:transcriptional regulator with XRE-family HTH domain
MPQTDLLIKLGKKIKAIRKEKKITQSGLASACHFRKESMSRIESGQANPTIRTLYKISCALNVKMVDLLNDD